VGDSAINTAATGNSFGRIFGKIFGSMFGSMKFIIGMGLRVGVGRWRGGSAMPPAATPILE
jgi:hypothetical protein